MASMEVREGQGWVARVFVPVIAAHVFATLGAVVSFFPGGRLWAAFLLSMLVGAVGSLVLAGWRLLIPPTITRYKNALRDEPDEPPECAQWRCSRDAQVRHRRPSGDSEQEWKYSCVYHFGWPGKDPAKLFRGCDIEPAGEADWDLRVGLKPEGETTSVPKEYVTLRELSRKLRYKPRLTILRREKA